MVSIALLSCRHLLSVHCVSVGCNHMLSGAWLSVRAMLLRCMLPCEAPLYHRINTPQFITPCPAGECKAHSRFPAVTCSAALGCLPVSFGELVLTSLLGWQYWGRFEASWCMGMFSCWKMSHVPMWLCQSDTCSVSLFYCNIYESHLRLSEHIKIELLIAASGGFL